MNLDNFQLTKQGAEARVYTGIYLGRPTIAKERFLKKYRISELDNSLTKERMKAECRGIVKCKTVGVPTPTLYLVDFERRIIFMEHIEKSVTLKDFINGHDKNEGHRHHVCLTVGNLIGKMHANNIIHGDLTTSNMLVVNEISTEDNPKVVVIDFGLSHYEANTEGKGVDLYVLERAINSTHTCGSEIIPLIMKGYKQGNKNGFHQVFAKYEEVRSRGRKRTMIG